MLGNAKRPADHGPVRSRIGIRHIADDVCGNACLSLGVFERVGRDGTPVLVESRSCVFDEFLILQAGRNNFSGQRVRERDIGTNVEAGPRVRPLNGARTPWIDCV